MKVSANLDRCMGSGVCEAICPEVFTVEKGQVRVIDGQIPESLRVQVEEAVESCPTEALTAQDD